MEAVLCFFFFFFFLGSNVEITPNPREELTFMQADLGKRTVDSDISHVEILCMLKQVHCLIACVIKGHHFNVVVQFTGEDIPQDDTAPGQVAPF